jgi:perosamine synthetase
LSQSADFIPLAVPDLRGNELKYLAECVEDNWVSSAGPHVIALEETVADLAGCAFGVATSNGTAALHLALKCAGVMPGDQVIVPDWTFAATANAVHHAGAMPYFVDVDPETWTLSPGLVEEALAADSDSHKISAVLAVHVLGLPADMDRLREICQAADVALLEDAAGAIGARYKGQPVGGLARAGTFSFNGNKTVTAGGGGMIVTNDEGLARRAKHLSTQARPGSDYIHDEIGYNYRMTNINAALGLAQMERLDEMVAAKRRIARVYDQAIAGHNNLATVRAPDGIESSCWLYSVLADSRENAESIVGHLNAGNIGARGFWHGLSKQKPFNGSQSRLDGTSASISGRVFSLPCSSSLTENEQGRVIQAILDWRHKQHA